MIAYKVHLKDNQNIHVDADDCEVADAETNHPWYNFWVNNGKDVDFNPTVAIFPYDLVMFVEKI